MSTYTGIATGPTGPVGRINISLSEPDKGRRIVTGNLKAGTRPTGLTGFTGDWLVDGGFSAAGQNKTQNNPENPFDDVHLVVDIAGTQRGTTVIGTILATVNGAPYEWTFEAFDIETDPRAAALMAASSQTAPTSIHAVHGPMMAGAAEVAGPVKKGAMAVLYAIPAVGVLVGGVTLAGFIGKKLKKVR